MLLKTERGIVSIREIPSGNAYEGWGQEGGEGEVKELTGELKILEF